MSKVSPLIMINKKGDVQLVAGAAGGFFIPTALGTVIFTNYYKNIDFGKFSIF